MGTRVLIADDEKTTCMLLQKEFASAGFSVDLAYHGEEAITLTESNYYDVAVLDINMPQVDGLHVLEHLKRHYPHTLVIMMTAFGSIDGAVRAMKMRADDYITKPFDPANLLEKAQRLVEVRDIVSGRTRTSTDAHPMLIGSSSSMREMQKRIDKIKNLNVTVLITGESGTGKGVAAKNIHAASNRGHQPFVHIDCASLPPSLIESELYGYEKGAFTNANTQHKGKLEQAGKGTIFFDEISTLSPELQSKLLIVLQDKYFMRVGGTKRINLESRIIAASNDDLEAAVANGNFRADLYYRLNIVQLECTPLRQRRDDIIDLAKYFIGEHVRSTGIVIQEVDEDVWQALYHYDWPGNVRELENALESAVVLSDGHRLRLADLPKNILPKSSQQSRPLEDLSLESQEITTILSALERHKGHREKTAKDLGISRRTLQYKLAKYKLINS